MKRIFIILLSAFIAFYGCTPEQPAGQDNTEQGETGKDDGKDGDKEEPTTPENPDKPTTGGDENPDKPTPGGDENPDKPGGDAEETVEVAVVDPGQERVDTKPSPQHPDLEHEVEYTDFYNSVQDELDEFGNIDYVCAQGNGTAWPLVTSEGYIRFYQGSASKGGGYIRVRAHNGAKIQSVTVGSATATRLAYSLNGKAKKSATTALDAGGRFSVNEECSEVCLWCMGTAQGERWELNYIKVNYKGGFIEDDYLGEEKEYGPLVRVTMPFREGFEKEFYTSDTPSYYKYGITSGRENLQWYTWYGSFSWQKPITGNQSAQLRVYQEEEDYYQAQFGNLKMEYFIEGLSKVSFSYKMSHYWIAASISYCEFGSNEWKSPQQIALNYSEWKNDKTVHHFTYDLGKKVNAKIKIELDASTGYPSSGHYDLYLDDFIFE